jgi:hypothetical protein
MKTFAFIWLDGKECQVGDCFYGGMKGCVELSFLRLFELFPHSLRGDTVGISAVRFGGSFPVVDAIESQFTCVIKQTLQLLTRAFSVRFAGNPAGTGAVRLQDRSDYRSKSYGVAAL